MKKRIREAFLGKDTARVSRIDKAVDGTEKKTKVVPKPVAKKKPR